MFTKILIANRGEIALRVMRTCARLGIQTVAVYSDADANAPHVARADQAVHLGPATASESYLKIDTVLEAARATGAQAIHPGYGFLSENAQFAAACEDAGIVFLGPTADAIRTMGDKITAKQAVATRGVPLVPGVAQAGLTNAELEDAATEVGFPVLIKPSAGGGGKGMHAVFDPADLPQALEAARREAANSFGDDTLFIERLIATPRHIEVQILADQHGNIIHLGERECSLQRRHQKVIEEAPSALLDAATRARIGEAAVETARSVGYRGAGTVEFIASADQPDEFFFMEMNTRLQVEHPVTEQVTGIDLVEWQLRIGAGETLSLTQDAVTLTGHSVEARIYAEDPARGFLPTGGRALDVIFDSHPIAEVASPSSEPATSAGSGDAQAVRIDAGLIPGQTIVSDYDPMIAKVITTAPTRAEALAKMDAVLAHSAVPGIVTNIDFVRMLITRDDVVAGALDTGLIDRLTDTDLAHTPTDIDALIAATAVAHGVGTTQGGGNGKPTTTSAKESAWQATGWRSGGRVNVKVDLTYQGEPVQAAYRGEPTRVEHTGEVSAQVAVSVGEVSHRGQVWVTAGAVWVASPRGVFQFGRPVADTSLNPAGAGATIVAPMPGAVTAVQVADGDEVTEGQPVVVLEAMKMEHVLRAPVAGRVELSTVAGAQVALDEVLATVIETDNDSVSEEEK